MVSASPGCGFGRIFLPSPPSLCGSRGCGEPSAQGHGSTSEPHSCRWAHLHRAWGQPRCTEHSSHTEILYLWNFWGLTRLMATTLWGLVSLEMVFYSTYSKTTTKKRKSSKDSEPSLSENDCQVPPGGSQVFSFLGKRRNYWSSGHSGSHRQPCKYPHFFPACIFQKGLNAWDPRCLRPAQVTPKSCCNQENKIGLRSAASAKCRLSLCLHRQFLGDH